MGSDRIGNGIHIINSAWEKTLCSGHSSVRMRVCVCVCVTACTWTLHSHVVCAMQPTPRLPLAPQLSRSHPGTRTIACLTCLRLALYILLLVFLLFYLDFKMFQSALQVRYNLCLFLAAWEYLGEYTAIAGSWGGAEGAQGTKHPDNGDFYNVHHCPDNPIHIGTRWGIIETFLMSNFIGVSAHCPWY